MTRTTATLLAALEAQAARIPAFRAALRAEPTPAQRADALLTAYALDAPEPTHRDVTARERAGQTGGLSRRGAHALGLCVCDGEYGPDDATHCIACGGEL